MTTRKKSTTLTPVAKAYKALVEADKAYIAAVEAEAAKPENRITAIEGVNRATHNELRTRISQLEQIVFPNAYADKESVSQSCQAQSGKHDCIADKGDTSDVKRGTKDAIIDRILDRVRASLGRVISVKEGEQKIKITIDTSDK